MTDRKSPAKKSSVRATAGTRSKEERGAELHETPAFAVRLLMEQWPDFFGQPRVIFEPHCGPGQLVAALSAAGHSVIAADKVDYEKRWRADWTVPRYWGRDFLSWQSDDAFLRGVDAIVMNPPFSEADAHILQALKLVPRVFVLLELTWMSGIGDARSTLVDDGPLIAFHPFKHRVPMHADNFTGKRNKNSRRHAWFVFERPGDQPARAPVMRRIGLATREERIAEGVWS